MTQAQLDVLELAAREEIRAAVAALGAAAQAGDWRAQQAAQHELNVAEGYLALWRRACKRARQQGG